jgi:cell division protein FtsA
MEYIAVLDLGTSKMLALAADKNDRQNILAIEQVESGDSIRRGLIYKPAEAARQIVELVRRLNRKLMLAKLPPLQQIYLGVGGQGLHTQAHSAQKNIGGQPVSDEILDLLRDECHSDWDNHFDLIEKTSPEYYIDGQLEAHPQEVKCENLEACFQLILGHLSDFRTAVEQALQVENIELVDVFVSPIATAEQVLTPREKERGCALIESGAGITHLSIYKNHLLRHLIALPIAGNAITRDICSLDKTETEAEALKIAQGNAADDDKNNEINTLIRARAEEILVNILHQIKTVGYEHKLPAGFILTGGTSQLRGLDLLLEKQTGQSVRLVEDHPEQSCARGLLRMGNENCARPLPKRENPPGETLFGGDEIEVVSPEPKKKKPSFSDRLKITVNRITDIVEKDLFDGQP